MRFLILFCAAVLPVGAFAQASNVAFGQVDHDTSLPVEITADELSVDQSAGTAVFLGNVVAGQGAMRLSAGRVEVTYGAKGANQIEKLTATGGVTLVNGSEQAEAQQAVYAVETSQIVMSGDVLLTQGQNALSGKTLTVDLTSGSGRIEGGVKTIFQTGGDP